MLTFFYYPKCATCQKAKALLDSYHTQYIMRNIQTDKPGILELISWLELSGLPAHKFFNTNGSLYKSLGLKDKLPYMSENECLILLERDGMLVKRPLLIDEYRALVGFDRNEWEAVFTEYPRKKMDKIFNDYLDEMYQLVKTRQEKDGSGMVKNVIASGNGNIAVVNSAVPVFFNGPSALDLAVFIEKEYNCRNIVMNKSAVTEDFFNLSTGIAGEVAQKFVNYGYRIAIIGDFSDYTSKPLHDFIYECNKGNYLYFVADEGEAVRKLSDGGLQ